MRRPAFLVAALALLAPLLLTTTATPAHAAPPYERVVDCPGSIVVSLPMRYGQTSSYEGTLRIWYSPADQGTYCAKVYDNLPGPHYMNVTIQRADWTTILNDPGTWDEYAGGVLVRGVSNVEGRKICVKVRGVLQANGVNYNAGYDIPCAAD